MCASGRRHDYACSGLGERPSNAAMGVPTHETSPHLRERTAGKVEWDALAIVGSIIVAVAILVVFLELRPSSPSSAKAPSIEYVAVTFTSDPVGAVVSIDGVKRGVTPLTVNRPKGQSFQYTVEASEPYKDYDLYKPHRGGLTPTKGEAVSVWLDRTTAAEQAAQRTAYEAAQKAEQERIRRQRLANADLIIEGWNWSRNDRYQSMEWQGKVTNNRNTTLSFVKAYTEFYTDKDEFISSDWTYLAITALLPGQSSTFDGYADWNPAASYARIHFVDRSGSQLYAMNRKDAEAP